MRASRAQPGTCRGGRAARFPARRENPRFAVAGNRRAPRRAACYRGRAGMLDLAGTRPLIAGRRVRLYAAKLTRALAGGTPVGFGFVGEEVCRV